jgi:hypothetical protein
LDSAWFCAVWIKFAPYIIDISLEFHDRITTRSRDLRDHNLSRPAPTSELSLRPSLSAPHASSTKITSPATFARRFSHLVRLYGHAEGYIYTSGFTFDAKRAVPCRDIYSYQLPLRDPRGFCQNHCWNLISKNISFSTTLKRLTTKGFAVCSSSCYVAMLAVAGLLALVGSSAASVLTNFTSPSINVNRGIISEISSGCPAGGTPSCGTPAGTNTCCFETPGVRLSCTRNE